MTRILIIGATGQQGGAVINELLAAKVPSLSLRALTRNTTSPAATRLTSRGIEVVQGSLEDHASLVSALQGVDSAFLAIADGPKERKQGLSFLKAAEEVNLPYLVYSSAPEVANADGIAILEDKLVIEATLRKTSIEHTVLHPWFFYEIFPVEPGFKRWLTLGASDYLLQGKSLVTTAVADIGTPESSLSLSALVRCANRGFLTSTGWFGAQALLHQKRYTGRVIPILGDNLTMSEAQVSYWRPPAHSTVST